MTKAINNITIVGYGFVGKAVHYGFSDCNVHIVDPILNNNKISDFSADFIFICVPTPMGDDGNIDTSIIEKVFKEACQAPGYSTIVIKSTVPPTWINSIKGRFVYNPEFLTETSALEDFANPMFHIFGGNDIDIDKVEQLYTEYSNCTPCPVFRMTNVEASFTKYMVNAYLATKVAFFNDFKLAMEDWEGIANFNTIIKALGTDPRIGHGHTKVPGHDGKRGYGGSCFPKDVSAIINSFDLPILEFVHKRNSEIRSEEGMTNREIEQNVHFEK